jgi:hypothetical protein
VRKELHAELDKLRMELKVPEKDAPGADTHFKAKG